MLSLSLNELFNNFESFDFSFNIVPLPFQLTNIKICEIWFYFFEEFCFFRVFFSPVHVNQHDR